MGAQRRIQELQTRLDQRDAQQQQAVGDQIKGMQGSIDRLISQVAGVRPSLPFALSYQCPSFCFLVADRMIFCAPYASFPQANAYKVIFFWELLVVACWVSFNWDPSGFRDAWRS